MLKLPYMYSLASYSVFFFMLPTPFLISLSRNPAQTHHPISPPPVFLQITPPPSHQLDSSPQEGLKRRNHSVCRSEIEAPPVPIFLQQGSAVPPIPQLAGTSPIDAYARVLFPLTFAFFNLVYWYIYLAKDTMEGARYRSHT